MLVLVFRELFGLCWIFGCGFAVHVHDLLKPKDVVCPLALGAMSISASCGVCFHVLIAKFMFRSLIDPKRLSFKCNKDPVGSRGSSSEGSFILMDDEIVEYFYSLML